MSWAVPASEHDVEVALHQHRVAGLRGVEGEVDIRLDHVARLAALEEFDGGFAHREHVGRLGPRAGAQQGEPGDAFGRLAGRFHRDHAAHRGTAEHQRPRVLAQHGGGHGFDGVVARLDVAHAGVEGGGKGRPLGLPEAIVAGEAGQQDKVGHGAILRDHESRQNGKVRRNGIGFMASSHCGRSPTYFRGAARRTVRARIRAPVEDNK
jgi:hypothetical protein